ncbi:MAG: 3' terminal RNA ribose 2'-O-methyltransferase Hen1 [Salibacteraceae bacterium]
MLLTLQTTHRPATDLGYLLHKHPGRFQSVDLSHGKAHIFYPEASESRCKVALLLEIDPIALVRNTRNQKAVNFSLGQYVNDRPYVASSFMSVALSKAFNTAMNAKCKDKPALVAQALPFEVELHSLPAPKGGEVLIRKLFEPLGYTVELERQPLDAQFETWGMSKYFRLVLRHTLPLHLLLTHLYVLIPVLDNDKHYYVSKDEIDKLIERGGTWLQEHPEREQITQRYLLHLKSLTRNAMDRMLEQEADAENDGPEEPEEMKARKVSLHQQRLKQAVKALKASGASRVLDLGCGEGKLLRLLLRERQFREICGMDASFKTLQNARKRLYMDEFSPRQNERLKLIHGALTYRDKRLEGYDAAAIIEVIEHLDENRLQAFSRVVFEFARPETVVLTTPNAEYNVRFETLPAGAFRHPDHRFEWTRQEFETWARAIGDKFGYRPEFSPVGEEDPEVGGPSQMAVFTRNDVLNQESEIDPDDN